MTISQRELDKASIIKYRAENDYLFFVRFMHFNMYGEKFIVSGHHKVMANGLERVARHEIKNLLINIPPRYSKTDMSVVYYVPWCIAKNPRAKFLHLSYGDEVVLENSSNVRDIILNEEFQYLWPTELKDDRNSKKKWYTVNGGGMYSTAAGGQVTGFGAGVTTADDDKFYGGILIDDPLKPDDAQTVEREKVNRRLHSTIKSRRNSPSQTPTIITMQRVDIMDMAGYVQDGGYGEPFHHINMPALIENDDGSKRALWPFKHTVEMLEADKQADPVTFNAQYQQDPAPLSGGVVEIQWFRRYKKLPPPDEIVAIYQSWDTAIKTQDYNDPSVCITAIATKDRLYIKHVSRQRLEYPDLKRLVIAQGEAHNPHVILIEDKASGQQLLQDIRRETRLPLVGITPIKDKETRMRVHTPYIEAGNVYLPESSARNPWLPDFEIELMQFPNSANDDQVDSLSQLLAYLRKLVSRGAPKVRQL